MCAGAGSRLRLQSDCHSSKDPSSTPRTHARDQLMAHTSECWGFREGDPWNFLASQPNLIGEPKVPVRGPSSKIKAGSEEIVQ